MSQPQKAPAQMGFPEPSSDDPFALMDQLQSKLNTLTTQKQKVSPLTSVGKRVCETPNRLQAEDQGQEGTTRG